MFFFEYVRKSTKHLVVSKKRATFALAFGKITNFKPMRP